MRPERGHRSDGVAHIVLFACAWGKQVSICATLQFDLPHKPWIFPVYVLRVLPNVVFGLRRADCAHLDAASQGVRC